jgi:hypothetical protein
METWLIILVIAVLVMAEFLRIIGKGGKTPRKGFARYLRREPSRNVNYRLAPRNPEVMAGALFDLLTRKLNYEQMLAFGELVTSSEVTRQYVNRLAERKATESLALELAFLAESMEANGFTPEQRVQVSEALLRKTRNEYKLLKIQKNMDKLF